MTDKRLQLSRLSGGINIIAVLTYNFALFNIIKIAHYQQDTNDFE